MELIAGLDQLRDKFGRWPPFHDTEILRILIDRAGPSIELELLVIDKREWDGPHFEVDLRFDDIENLLLEHFNYQNVIFELTVDRVTERRFATGHVEERIKIGIASVFGAACSFTCASAKVIRVQETDRRTGDPSGNRARRAQPPCA